MFFYKRRSDQHDRPEQLSVPIVVAFTQIRGNVPEAWSGVLSKALSSTDRPVCYLSAVPLSDEFQEALGIQEASSHLWMVFDLVVAADGEDEALPVALLRFLFGLRIRSSKKIDQDGHFSNYVRRQNSEKPRVLFIFPGLFFPPELGSHQRACALSLKLLEAGYELDFIVQSSNPDNLKSRQQYFDLISPNVTLVSPPKQLKSNRRLQYEYICSQQKNRPRFPPSLEERSISVAPQEMKEAFDTHLSEYDYAAVLASYVWLHPLFSDIEKPRPNLIVDTHDVHCLRLAEHLDAAAEIVFDLNKEREAEIEALSLFDHVLAISERDLNVFRQDYKLSNVTNLPVGYLGGDLSTRPARSKTPLRFGFIGSGMDANRQALELILSEWWPAIHEFSPESPLLIAGRIANDSAVQDAIFLRDEIEPIGFVEFTQKFFEDIDVLLSPVVIPGGLNIKIVEGLLNSCVVVTNQLGSEPLKPLEIATRAETGAEVVRILSQLEETDNALMQAIAENFAVATEIFKGGRDDVEKIRAIFSS